MFVKLLIISIILMAFVVLALGVKMILDPGSGQSSHKCVLEDSGVEEIGSCSACQLKELTECAEESDLHRET